MSVKSGEDHKALADTNAEIELCGTREATALVLRAVEEVFNTLPSSTNIPVTSIDDIDTPKYPRRRSKKPRSLYSV